MVIKGTVSKRNAEILQHMGHKWATQALKFSYVQDGYDGFCNIYLKEGYETLATQVSAYVEAFLRALSLGIKLDETLVYTESLKSLES